MGQCWEILNVDRREIGIADGGKLAELFFSDLGYVYESLRIPRLPKVVDKWLSNGTSAIQPEPIGALPPEVLHLLFEAILNDTEGDQSVNFLTCISLAIGCKWLLSIGKDHVLRALIRRCARAADCRLVCLGEYADKDDQAPPGMLTDAEIKEVETTKILYKDFEFYEHDEDDEDDEDDELTDDDVPERCLYNFATELYQDYGVALVKQRKAFTLLMDRIGRAHRQLLSAEPENRRRQVALARDLKMLRTLAGAGSRVAYPARPNVLCNMSKGECVRETALVKLKSEGSRVTLAHALLSRICYSPDPSISMGSREMEDRFAKGPWAGDRFRITSESDMPLLEGGKEWKDATEEANEILRHIWRAYDMMLDAEVDGGDEAEGSTPSTL